MDRPDPGSEPGGQHLLELGERRDRGVLEAGHAAVGRRPQAHGHGHRLVVVEQERRQRPAPPEPVAAHGADGGVDGVPQPGQAGDVAVPSGR